VPNLSKISVLGSYTVIVAPIAVKFGTEEEWTEGAYPLRDFNEICRVRMLAKRTSD